jgi:Na+-transporting NADH:ubiquinone oxidoreductase subunit NqrB
MWWWALGHDLLGDDVDSRREAKASLARNAGIGLVFAASIPVAFVDPDTAKYLWLLLILVPGLVARVVRRRTG